jgi:purine-binding chemotaxis protein CheW
MSTPAVVVPIGQDHYAIAANMVREVVSDPHPTRLPTAPAVFLGVFNLRGEVVPMFDSALLLGIGRLTGPSMAVVVNTKAGPAGLAVSGLPRVVELEAELAPSELRGTLGVFDADGDVAVLIDVEVLLASHTSLGVAATNEALVDR